MSARLHAHHQEADDHSDIAHCIGEETPPFSDLSNQNSGNGWTNDARPVEHG